MSRLCTDSPLTMRSTLTEGIRPYQKTPHSRLVQKRPTDSELHKKNSTEGKELLQHGFTCLSKTQLSPQFFLPTNEGSFLCIGIKSAFVCLSPLYILIGRWHFIFKKQQFSKSSIPKLFIRCMDLTPRR